MSDQEMTWICASPDGNKGPYTRAQMEGLLAAGHINAESWIWRQGMATWTQLGPSGDVPNKPAGAAAPAALPQAASVTAATRVRAMSWIFFMGFFREDYWAAPRSISWRSTRLPSRSVASTCFAKAPCASPIAWVASSRLVTVAA